MGSQVWNKRHPLWQYSSAKSPANPQWKWWSQRNWCSKPYGKAALYDENYICHGKNRNSGCHLAQCLLVVPVPHSPSGKRPLQIQGFHPSFIPETALSSRGMARENWSDQVEHRSNVSRISLANFMYAPFEPKRRRPQTQVGEARDFCSICQSWVKLHGGFMNLHLIITRIMTLISQEGKKLEQ